MRGGVESGTVVAVQGVRPCMGKFSWTRKAVSSLSRSVCFTSDQRRAIFEGVI